MTALFRKAQKRKQARLKPAALGAMPPGMSRVPLKKQKRLSRTLFGWKSLKKSQMKPLAVFHGAPVRRGTPVQQQAAPSVLPYSPAVFSAGGRTAPCSNAAFRQAPASGRPAPSATASFRPGRGQIHAALGAKPQYILHLGDGQVADAAQAGADHAQ